MSKLDLIIKARSIMQRVEIAANGQRSTDDWADAGTNLSAPGGKDYWDWIYEAEAELIRAINELEL